MKKKDYLAPEMKISEFEMRNMILTGSIESLEEENKSVSDDKEFPWDN